MRRTIVILVTLFAGCGVRSGARGPEAPDTAPAPDAAEDALAPGCDLDPGPDLDRSL